MTDFNALSEKDKLKYEIAEELGLLDKVREKGWLIRKRIRQNRRDYDEPAATAEK